MGRRTERCGWLTILLLTCGSLLSAQTLPMSDGVESARQTTASTDEESASSLEARQDALKKLNDAVPLFIGSGETVEAARLLNRIGRLQQKLNTPETAVDSYNQALSLLRTTPDKEVEVNSLNGLAAAYLVLKKMTDVAAVLQKSLTLSQQSGYTRGQAQALLTLSELQNFSDHVIGLETGEKALALWQTLDDKSGLARAYSQVGRCLMAQNRLPEATEHYQVALQSWRELNDRAEQAEALIMLAFIEERKAEWQLAISYLTEAQGLIDEHAEPRKMGQIAAGLGDAFNENGLPETGLVHYQRALEYYKQTQDPRSVRSATWGIGYAYFLMHNYTEATNYFQEVLRQLPPDSLDATEGYEYLGRMSLESQDYSEALRLFEKSLSILVRAGNPMEAARVRGLIGQVFAQQGLLAVARQWYKKALVTFDNLTDRIDQGVIDYALGQLELRAGDLKTAEYYLRRSIEVTENIRQAPTSSDLTAAFSATVHDRYESYVDCLMLQQHTSPQLGLAIRAFEINEQARARSLIDLLQATQTNLVTGLDPKLAAQEKSLRQSIRLKEDSKVTLLSAEYKKQDLEVVDAELSRLEADYNRMTETLRQRYPSYAGIMHPPVWNLSQIQERVVPDEDTLLLEYALGRARSYLWLVTRTGIFSYELPPRTQIEDAARRFYKLLTANQPVAGETFEQRRARVEDANAHLDSEGAAFTDMILGPAMNQLGKKRLLIVPDGALQYIPFQALMVARSTDSTNQIAGADINGRVSLIMEHEIVNEPSAAALALVSYDTFQRQPAPKSVAVFANPVFEANDPRVGSSGSNPVVPTGNQNAAVYEAFRDVGINDLKSLPPLPASRDEADAIVSSAPWRSTFEALDFRASRATIAKTDLSQFRIIHFATHGFVDYEHPALSGLVLSLVDQQGQPQEGFLRMHDIYNLKLPVDLVVLSACNTGLGKEVASEGLMGLTRGFMYAGARGVAASLWKVDDEATAELMKRFYEGMFKNGLTPAAALREAQLAMWQQKRWHAPYYWAAFVIQGQYNQKEMVADGTSYVWLVSTTIVSLAFLSALLLLIKRRQRSSSVRIGE